MRTLLFVPGDDPRKAEKAFAAGADAVILDLEDAVAETHKEKARQQVRQTLGVPRPIPVFVRINGVSSPHILQDLQMVVDLPVEGLMVAKAESGEELRRVDWLLSLLEQQHQLSPGKIKLIPFVESARGIARAGEIAAAPRVSCLAFGGNDYTMDIGVPYSREGE
ncbi:HpcH/HpaI aldolase/citrate lyase family protein, partial [Desulfofundulus sp.]|uniref:HpcH/HpaI aldolase/citrate lyase family protein n=1 Tax=Desulfofundulus sp. TaxID=2282750 RepID=UPI003C721C95